MEHVLFGLFAVFLAVRSLTGDVFLDESESAPVSEEEREHIGWKATPFTRSLMMALFGGIALW